MLEIKMVYKGSDGKLVIFDFDEEFDGIRKLFVFVGLWIDVFENGYVLFIDELYDNLYLRFVCFLVEFFYNVEINLNNV